MKSVVRYSLNQIVLINVVFVFLVVAGLFSLFTTPVENMPPVDIGRAYITTVYYGASAEDIENIITNKIEDALDGLENVEFIESESKRNYSIIVVKFLDDTDYSALYDELRLRVLNVKEELPPQIDGPSFLYVDTQVWMPVMEINLVGDIPNRSLELLAEELKTFFKKIPGVREVIVFGKYKSEFHVSVDPEKLRKFGITFNMVAEAIKSANTKIPTGRFITPVSEYLLNAGKRLSSQEEVLDVVIRSYDDSNFIRVRDVVTDARLSHRDPDFIFSVNGKSSVKLVVRKEPKGDSVKIAKAIKDVCGRFEESHRKDGIAIELTRDSTIEIYDSIRTLTGNMVLGMLFVTVALWLILGFRNAMLTAIGIPFSFLFAVIIIKCTGLSINTIALFSFVLVSGIIVDDAVIIVENVYRHMQMGKSPRESIVDGVAEVMLPVINSALTTVLAFTPMLVMTGSTGEFFSVVPKTVSYALAASLVEALFILPIHILDWGPRNISSSVSDTKDSNASYQHLRYGIFAPVWNIYYKILKFLLARKALTVGSLVGLLLLALAILGLSITGIAPLINIEFFPGNYFRYHIVITLPPETPMVETDLVVRDISRFILSLGKKQAQSASGATGMYEDEDYMWHYGHHIGQVVVTLPEKKILEFPDNPKNDPMFHLDYIRERLRSYVTQKYPDIDRRPSLKVFAENMGPPAGKAVNIRVSGSTFGEVARAADSILNYLKCDEDLSGLTDLKDNRALLKKVVKYIPVEEEALEYSLSPGIVTSLVAYALNGWYVGKYKTDEEEIDLLVRLARASDRGNTKRTGLADPVDILGVPVIEHVSSPVVLGDIVEMSYVYEPDTRTRYNGKPTLTITSDIKAGSMLSSSRVQVLVKRFFGKMADEYPGVTIGFGGEFETTSRTYDSLYLAFIIAILGIYLVLAAQFKDYFQPAIILSSVGSAIIGVVLGMFVTRTTFNIGSFMAVIGLAGIVVNDAIILVDFMNTRKRSGKPLRDAVIEACGARMRPVIITTVTTILGLLPMAMGIPSRSIQWAPMAVAFITGLFSATMLTLVIVPVGYELSEKLTNSMRRVTRV